MGRSIVWVVTCLAHACLFAAPRSLVETPETENAAVIVGVSHGLPGIDIDVKNIEAIATHPSYDFDSLQLNETQGTIRKVEAALTAQAQVPKADGSFFFYFSGHGSVDNIYLQDGLFGVGRLRSAIEKARAGKGPLGRLILMFDSCYSGSLLGPFNLFRMPSIDAQAVSEILANRVAGEFASRGQNYWSKLFVFASSRADESSLAGEDGSVFTLALKRAYDEAIEENSPMSDWIAKTKQYTDGHHPVERLVPESLASEPMIHSADSRAQAIP